MPFVILLYVGTSFCCKREFMLSVSQKDDSSSSSSSFSSSRYMAVQVCWALLSNLCWSFPNCIDSSYTSFLDERRPPFNMAVLASQGCKICPLATTIEKTCHLVAAITKGNVVSTQYTGHHFIVYKATLSQMLVEKTSSADMFRCFSVFQV